MYVSVDHDRRVFLHKHADFRVVRDLDYITRSYESASCFPADSPQAFDHLSVEELQTLFRNTTGKDANTTDPETLYQMLSQIAVTLPNTDCVPTEVEIQAAHMEATGAPQGFVYVRGSYRPGKAGDLYSLTADADPAALLPAARKAVAERKLAAQQRAATKPEPSAPAAPRTAPARANAGARPKSGVCAAIHEALDLDYKMTGVVPPRTRVKELALKHGWSLSTAGVQYGAWRKQNNLP